MPTCNNHPIETGCFIAGSWGQYIPDMLADLAETFGWRADGDSDEYPNEGYSNDPRYWRRVADQQDGRDGKGLARQVADADIWEHHHSATDAILYWLNDHTEGAIWDWSDGEIFVLTGHEWEDQA